MSRGLSSQLLLLALLACAPSPAHAATLPDYAGYQKLLDDYLHVVSNPGEPVETRFDYVGLDAQPGYPERMGRIRRAMMDVNVDSMSAKDRTAWAINAYNFRVLELVIRDLRDPRSHKVIPSIREIGFFHGVDFFEQPGLRVRDSSYTLNGFERKYLFNGFTRAEGVKRPKDLDPRVHFAIVCASVGCPPLMPRAYRGDSLDLQLDAAVRNALASPRQLQWLASESRLLTSQIFRWYERDFEPEGPIAFIERYGPATIASALREKNVKELDQDLPWDWSLNRYIPGAR